MVPIKLQSLSSNLAKLIDWHTHFLSFCDHNYLFKHHTFMYFLQNNTSTTFQMENT